jgi:hypothetical protein
MASAHRSAGCAGRNARRASAACQPWSSPRHAWLASHCTHKDPKDLVPSGSSAANGTFTGIEGPEHHALRQHQMFHDLQDRPLVGTRAGRHDVRLELGDTLLKENPLRFDGIQPGRNRIRHLCGVRMMPYPASTLCPWPQERLPEALAQQGAQRRTRAQIQHQQPLAREPPCPRRRATRPGRGTRTGTAGTCRRSGPVSVGEASMPHTTQPARASGCQSHHIALVSALAV